MIVPPSALDIFRPAGAHVGRSIQVIGDSLARTTRTYTVKTAVLLCELNRHITHFLRALLQVYELMERVLPEMRASMWANSTRPSRVAHGTHF